MIIISPQGQDITGVTWMLCSVLPIQELEFGTLLDILLTIWNLGLVGKIGTYIGTFSTTFLVALFSNWLPTFFLWVVVVSILLLYANRLLWFNFEKMTVFAARTLPTIQRAQLLFLFIFANSPSPFYSLFSFTCATSPLSFTTLTAESWYMPFLKFFNFLFEVPLTYIANFSQHKTQYNWSRIW